MNLFSTVSFSILLAAVSGCSQSPAPSVAEAYAKQYGPVETSRFTPCPKVQGVWQLSQLSAGSLQKANGELIEHFRWVGPMLFGLTPSMKDYIAIDQNSLETVLYLTHKLPGTSGRQSLSYSAKTEKEMPCVGHGWRQAAVRDHSLNDGAARVLNLVPERTPKITQTDYYARDKANELVLATRIDFQGTNKEGKSVTDGYWHFLKMPRLHENPKGQGFKY